jgi:septal ring factor EnvC (AmiA/AmiB activator)
MSDQTTGPDASGDAGNAQGPDYAAKYNGLQAAFQKRQNEWSAKEQAFEQERADHEAKAARLAEYEAREAAEREEQAAEAQFEALSERFAPTPLRHNGASRSIAGTGRDDGSADWAYGKIAGALGVSSEKTSWP